MAKSKAIIRFWHSH